MKIQATVATLVLLWAQLTPQSSTPDKSELEGEDYVVYAEVLRTHYVKDGVKRLVIGDQTMMNLPPVMMGMTQPGDTPEMKGIRETASKETLEDYKSKNKTPVKLEKRFSVGVPVVLVSESELDRLFEVKGEGENRHGNVKGFEELRRLYPDSPGFISISRIGFNSARTQAILYIGNLCGGLCGAGYVFLLVKVCDAWKIKYAAMTWIS